MIWLNCGSGQYIIYPEEDIYIRIAQRALYIIYTVVSLIKECC